MYKILTHTHTPWIWEKRDVLFFVYWTTTFTSTPRRHCSGKWILTWTKKLSFHYLVYIIHKSNSPQNNVKVMHAMKPKTAIINWHHRTFILLYDMKWFNWKTYKSVLYNSEKIIKSIAEYQCVSRMENITKRFVACRASFVFFNSPPVLIPYSFLYPRFFFIDTI